MPPVRIYADDWAEQPTPAFPMHERWNWLDKSQNADFWKADCASCHDPFLQIIFETMSIWRLAKRLFLEVDRQLLLSGCSRELVAPRPGFAGRGVGARGFSLSPPISECTPIVGPMFQNLLGNLLMKYMLLIYGDENAWNPEERTKCMIESTELCHELKAKGQYLGASPLYPIATATSVRLRDGKRLITDGPFAETVEQLGGYFLIDVNHLDEAIEIASRLPGGKRGTVEIRPIVDLAGLPPSD